MNDRTVVLQLVDRKRGVDPHGIYLAFTDKVASHVQDPAIQSSSDRIRMKIGELREIWKTKDYDELDDREKERIAQRAQDFAGDFSQYLVKVQAIR